MYLKFYGAIEDCLQNNEKIYIGLSGGRSLDSFYQEVLKNSDRISVKQWKKVYFCLLDERIVPYEHIESNSRSVYEKFLWKLSEKNLILPHQIMKFDFHNRNIARHYEKQIPRVHIALFGVGEDGHIASLFPNHEWIHFRKTGFTYISDSPKPPSDRITITRKFIEKIDYAFAFFIGEEKKQAYDNFINEKISENECPVKLIQWAKNWEIEKKF